MNRTNPTAVGLAFATVLFLGSTGQDPKTAPPPRYRPAIYTKYQRNDQLAAGEAALVKRHCAAGLPKHRAGAPLGPSRYIFRDAYVLENSLEFRTPLWVCEKLTRDDVSGSAERLETSFKADPELKRWPHAKPGDFRGSGFAQGHMAPDADRQDDELKKQTYFLSNIVPQSGQRFNSTIWLQLEKKVRAWTKARGTCYVVTGAFVHDPKEEDERLANGLVEYQVIGKTPVGVPTHLFKIVLAKNSDGNWESLAFVFLNQPYEAGTDLGEHLESIHWIEERTGLNFLPAPPAGLNPAELRPGRAPRLWPTQ